MLSPRIRRLKLDYESLQQRLAGWPVIRLVGAAGMPPELYRFQYLVRGLYVAPDGAILERNEHVLEVNLSLGYPRRAPQCRMLTPVFHPNFDDSSVCIGDFWAASEGLDDLIVRIGRMIAYQEYNTKSPLNGLAAKWAAQNPQLLPVDPQPIAPPLQQATPQATQLVAPQETPQTSAQPAPQTLPATEESAPSLPANPVPALQPEGGNVQVAPSSITPPGPRPDEETDPWGQKIVIS